MTATALEELGLGCNTFEGPAGTLAYSRGGTGEPLVLLHSLALSSQMWSSILPEFLSHHDVIACDARGHGESTWNKSEFSVEDMARDLLSLFDHLDLVQPNVLGLSMGGSTALTFAGMYPARINRLVLCDTTAWYGPIAEHAWEQRAETVERASRSDQIPFQLDRWFTSKFREEHPGIVSHIAGIFEQTDSHVHVAACRALGSLDARNLLPRIIAPTLVMTGSDDMATPVEMGQQVADMTHDASFHVVPGGHFAVIESKSGREKILQHLSY